MHLTIVFVTTAVIIQIQIMVLHLLVTWKTQHFSYSVSEVYFVAVMAYIR